MSVHLGVTNEYNQWRSRFSESAAGSPAGTLVAPRVDGHPCRQLRADSLQVPVLGRLVDGRSVYWERAPGGLVSSASRAVQYCMQGARRALCVDLHICIAI